MLSRGNAPRQGLEPQLPEPESGVLPIILSGNVSLFSFRGFPET